MRKYLFAFLLVAGVVGIFTSGLFFAPHATAQQTDTTFSASSFPRDLTVGDTGADVSALQQFLITGGFLHVVAPTGYFGDLTQAAVAAWQGTVSLPTTGFFGPLSRAAIAGQNSGSGNGSGTGTSPITIFPRDLTVGDTGADVSALQQFLITGGFLHVVAPTGYFGDLTQAAVAAWQGTVSLPTTGFFGPLSRAAIALILEAQNGGGSGTGSGSGGTNPTPTSTAPAPTSTSGGSGSGGGGGTSGGGGGCTNCGGGGGDTTPPTISLTTPASSSTVTGTVLVTANASDNVGVTLVQFYLDGIILGTPLIAPPYQVYWNTFVSGNGTHTLSATAYDAAGNYASTPIITTTVANAPTITLTAPANNATLSGTATLSANASSPGGNPTVQFVLNGLNFGPVLTAPPYNIYWDTTLEGNGTDTIRVKATDIGGNQSISPVITVTVNNTVNVNGPSIPTGLKVTGTTTSTASLSWTASTPGTYSIAGYKIYRGGAQVGTSTATTFTNTGLAASTTYTYTVAAYDTAGNTSAQSTSVSATTQKITDTTPPSILITAPANGATVSGTVTVGGTSSDNVAVASVQISIDSGAYVSAVGTTTWTYSLNSASLANGSHTITAKATDSSGNTSTASVTVTVNNTVNVNGPSIPTGLKVTGTTTSTASLSWTASTPGTYSIAGYKIYRGGAQVGTSTATTFTNTGLAASTTYTYTVAAYDTAGNTSAQSTSVSATTQSIADTTPPTVSVTSPASGSTVSSTITVVASASDNVGVTSVQFYLDGAMLGSPITAAPYQVSWNTTLSSNGSHSLSAKAYDAAGNVGTSANVTVTVSNSTGGGGTTPPSVPASFNAVPLSSSEISLEWSPSAAGSYALAGYKIYRGGTLIGTSTAALYYDRGLSAGTNYSYTVSAYDVSGNISSQSGATSATTWASGIPAQLFSIIVQNSGTTWPLTTAVGALPATGLRLWDDGVHWSQVETCNAASNTQQYAATNPSNPCYNWTTLDQYVRTDAPSMNMDVVYTFGATPSWATTQPSPAPSCGEGTDACLPPADVDAVPGSGLGNGTDNTLKDFVTALVTRYKGQIKYYELWNEPDTASQLTATTAQIIRMTGDEAAIIRSIDPSARIMSPSFHGGTVGAAQWLAGYVQAGGSAYFDVLNIHGRATGTNAPELFPTVYSNAQTVIQANGLSGYPLWDDEAGSLQGQVADTDNQASYVSREYIMQAMEGIGRFYWATWDSAAPYGLDNSIAGTAYFETANWLTGATFSSPCSEGGADGTVWSCNITKPGGYQAVIMWDTTQTCTSGVCTTATSTVGTQYNQYRDLLGDIVPIGSNHQVPVGLKPIIIETTGVVFTGPSLPTGLTVTGTTTSTASLSWTASIAGTYPLAGYKIYRGSVQVGTTTATSFTNIGLAASTTYGFTVASYDTSGNLSAQTSPVKATTQSVSDTTPPTTTITSPTSGSTVSGTITVSATASDNVGVTQVQLYLDSNLQGTDTTAPYTFSLNTLNFSNGSHVLNTKAYDAAGNIGISSNVNITISNSTGGGNTAPTTMFGFEVTNAVGGNVPAPSFNIYRFWDDTSFQWGLLETSPGCSAGDITCKGGYSQSGMSSFDSYMNDLYQHNPNMQAVYTMARTPNFISAFPQDEACHDSTTALGGPGQCDRPSDLNADGSGSNQTFRQWYAFFSNRVNSATYLENHAHIEYWEVWNEPDSAAFWGNGAYPAKEGIGSYDDLIRLTEDAECIIVGTIGNGKLAKETYPDGNGVYDTCAQVQASVGLSGPTDPPTAPQGGALIISPSFHPYGAFSMEDLQSYLYCNLPTNQGGQSCTGGNTLNAGALSTMALNMHMKPGYNCTTDPAGTNCTSATEVEPAYSSYITNLDAAIAKGSGLASNVPVWDDEADYGPSSFAAPYTEPDMAESYVGRFLIYGLSLGVTENTWYGYDKIPGTVKTNYNTAWNTVYQWLTGSTAGANMCSNNGSVYTCSFTDANGSTGGKAAEVMWDNSQVCTTSGGCTTSPESAGSFKTCTTIDGTSCTISGGSVNVGIKPILLQ